MNSRLTKWAAFLLAVLLCCTAMVGCKGKNRSDLPDTNSDQGIYPSKPSTSEGAPTVTVPEPPESNQDWSAFSAMGNAQEVFTRLGFAKLSEPEDNGNGNYTVYPYNVKEIPLLVKVADGKISEVVLSNLHVADGAKNAYHIDGQLPATWYLKGEKGYKDDAQHTVSVLLYDASKGDHPYVVYVDWGKKTLIYF